MFEDLYDSISLMFSRRWPKAEASIIRVYIAGARDVRIRVVYEFNAGDDGPYIGDSICPSWYGSTALIAVDEHLKIGKAVPVRYKRTDPSVNKIDSSFWHERGCL